MVTSPSINSASSNWVSATLVPFSALSILIALNVANANSSPMDGPNFPTD
jgi:hypothetical protein